MRTTRSLSYIARRAGHEGAREFRQAAYLAVTVTALVAFASLMPSLEYAHVEAVRVSTYDVWLSGPLDDADITRFAAGDGVDHAAPFLTLSVVDVRGPRTSIERSLAAGSITAMAYDDHADLTRGPFPEGLLIKGKSPGEGEWACDWNTAHRLRLRVGDIVRATASLPTTTVALSGRLAAVYGPSGLARDTLVMPATSTLTTAIADISDGARWTDLFVSCASPATLVGAVASGPDADRILAVPRVALESEARSRLLREVGPFLRSGATWTAIVAFVTLSLWQQSVRSTRRAREYAILSALGMDARALARLDTLEHVLVLAASALVGIVGAVVLLQEMSSTFVPPGTRLSVVLFVAATVIGTAIVGSVASVRRLRRRPLADALAAEGGVS